MGSIQEQNTLFQAHDDDETFLLAMQLAGASVLPMVLKSAVELDLFDTMAKYGPGAYVSPSELASKLPKQNPNARGLLDRMLRLLASHSVLHCKAGEGGVDEKVYRLAPVCKYFIKNQDSVSLSPLLLLCEDRIIVECWYYLKDAVLDGSVPFNKAHGMAAFEYSRSDPRFSNVFNQAMSNYTTMFMNKILEVYDGFDGIDTLVDVGGGVGTSLSMIVSKHPTIKGINFDLPHVINQAVCFPGIEHIAGDMFVNVPKGDAIFIKWVCHNWSDERCLTILKNCYEALPENGKAIVADWVLPEDLDTNLATQNVLFLDLIMSVVNPGAEERTERGFESLAKGAGFKHFRKVCFAQNIWIMEFSK